MTVDSKVAFIFSNGLIRSPADADVLLDMAGDGAFAVVVITGVGNCAVNGVFPGFGDGVLTVLLE